MSKHEEFVLLVVDNGSTKGNQKELKDKLPKDSRVHFRPIAINRGYVGGINYGLEEGKKQFNPEFFMIMNNDTILDKNAIEELLMVIQVNNGKVIATGKVYHYKEPDKLQFVGYEYVDKKYLTRRALGVDEKDKGQYDKVEERDMLDDIFWLFPAKLYDEIGGYSNYFWFNSEQADFALRAKKEGYKLIYTPNAKLWHKGSVSVGGRDANPRLAYWTVQSKLILKYLHLKRIYFWSFYLITVISVLRTFIKSIYYWLMGKEDIRDYALAKYKGLAYFNKWLVKKNENTGYNPF